MSTTDLHGVRACVFDAYGTLFDVSDVARGAKDVLGDGWHALSELWRGKQLQYTWLRGLSGHHADFWQVTADALEFAMTTLRIDDPALHHRLMQRYLSVSCYPEVPECLRQLKAGGMRVTILSNGTPAMLAAAVASAGISELVDEVVSVEEVGVFKPHPSVYALAPARLGIAVDRICFVSSNGWDAYSAKAFGYRVLWCNRAAQAPERLPATPDGELKDLLALAAIVTAEGVSSCGSPPEAKQPTAL